MGFILNVSVFKMLNIGHITGKIMFLIINTDTEAVMPDIKGIQTLFRTGHIHGHFRIKKSGALKIATKLDQLFKSSN